MRSRGSNAPERQRDGIQIAKAAGKYQGRARKLTDEQIVDAWQLVSTGVSKTVVARQLGIDRTTLYRMLALNSGLSASHPVLGPGETG